MITSVKNDQVKYLVQLQRSSKERRKADAYIVEGIRMVSEIPEENLIQLFCSESYLRRGQGSLPNCEVLSDHVFEHVSDTETPQGILAVVRQDHFSPEDLICGEDTLLVILDNLQNPGNMGTILRSAEACGVSGIILSEGCADLYNPKTVRGSMGSLFRVPCMRTASLADTMLELKNKYGVRCFATELAGSEEYDRVSYTGPCAIVIGNEGNGVSKEILELSDSRIRIPMEGQVESLNAGVAASVLLYEIYRQKRWNRA